MSKYGQSELSSLEVVNIRQANLRTLMEQAGFQAVILNPGPSMIYFTGLHFHLMERPVIAIVSTDKPLILVIPELEKEKTRGLPYATSIFQYGEDPATWAGIFQSACHEANFQGKIGVEPTRLRFLEFTLVQSGVNQAMLISAENILSEIRMQKVDSEIKAMRKAVDIAQNALINTIPLIKTGITEREIASELTLQLLRSGADTSMPFSPIVSGGPNSANPHAVPTERKIAEGDLLVIDWGAYADGYCSDITRTFAIGTIEDELMKIHEITVAANAEARKHAGPGKTAEQVDIAARGIIETAGYGNYFTHRTGHGIGMEGHEPPYIRSGNPLILKPGMSFTIEPGIYLPGRGGVRIEDDVVITTNGAESLSNYPRTLQFIG